jgi:hypothetical protein
MVDRNLARNPSESTALENREARRRNCLGRGPTILGPVPALQTAPPEEIPLPQPEAEGGPCLNCGALLTRAFCPECGQQGRDSRITLKELFQEFADAYLNLDSKLFRTLRALCRPGHLTVEYLAGRRANYVRPIMLYLVLSALSFAAETWVPNRTEKVSFNFGGVKIETQRDKDGASTARVVEVQERKGDTPFEQSLKARGQQLLASPEGQTRFIAALRENLGKLGLILFPVLALFLKLLHQKKHPHYVEHVIFVLHVMAFLSAAAALMTLSRLIPAKPVPAVVSLVGGAGCVAYGLLALRRVYQESWRLTLVKGFAVLILYLPLALMTLAAIALGTLWFA